ncbi:GlxA family transcriptional regulator [Sulfitobacter sp. S190]|uniref:GlxA family transcriptional regulator n=1 Tax=Sulfitobacter sp. S190 TaxID=2867022 RepID=UPI0021A2B4FB|nr:helix-turn-helix domain-containing protein [Sulfitobacter sp. S190]UWR20912.1 DJ-1/PfpI family protein [Sulfitobacter sp. S190]
MDTHLRPRRINVLLFDGVNSLDVAGPVQAFHSAIWREKKHYILRFVSVDGRPVTSCCGLGLRADAALDEISPRDDLLVPGGIGVDALLNNCRVLEAIVQVESPARIISICSGALVLASAGVLDGLPATTHWSRAADTARYPSVLWDLDRICTRNDRIYTSAGVSTGIDLALSMIRSDCGVDVALQVARELVVQLRRTGGQSQYAMHLTAQFTGDATLARLIERIVADPAQPWRMSDMATQAGMNARTLARHFNKELSQSPAQFVEKVRIDHARGLLLDGVPLKRVAAQSGFGDMQRMRRAFMRRFGVHPVEYAAAFG